VTTLTATLPRAPVRGSAATLWLGLAAAGALCLALRSPVATTVLGLVAFGVLHNVLELRYVAGRYESVLSGRFLLLLVALVSGVALCRLAPAGVVSRSAEIVLSYGLLAAACVRTLAGRRGWLAGSLVVVGAAATVSLSFPAYHFVVLGHLHNVVPLFFLWDWSRTMPDRTRRAFRAANLGWVVVVPAVLLSGALDGVLRGAPVALGGFGGVVSFDPARLAPAYTPPALSELGLRFLAAFAFMQTMHYVVWVGILPRYAPEAAARFDARVPILRRGRAWLLGAGLAVALGVVFAIDYTSGRTLYAAAASYHAYLEFPVLLALILAQPPLGAHR
jgi:hypothetical protein